MGGSGTERERQRVAELREYHLLDTPPAAEVEAVVRVAAAVAAVPAATLNLLDDARQYMLTTVGVAAQQCSREDSLCSVRLDRGEFVHLPDAREEPDYRDNPWVTGVLGRVVFYASAPLVSPAGNVMGTLCVFDSTRRELSPDQIGRLTDLAGIIVAFFERRRNARLTATLKETIQSRERWTATMLDSIDEAVVAIASDGRVTLFNRAARELHEPDVDLRAGPHGTAARYRLYEPGGTDPLPDDEVPLLKVMRTGEPVRGREMAVRVPDGSLRSVRANAAPLRSADGTVAGAVVALQDITAECARRRIIQEAHQRLAAANADLRRSNADLTDFAGAVSHDLVAPLAAVGGYLDLLTDLDDADLPGAGAGERRERVAELAGAAARSVARMRDLIDALLGYAAAGSAPVRAEAVPLTPLIASVVRDLEPEIGPAGARVTVPGVLPEVTGDPVLIRQLLQNLIGNAVRCRPPERPGRVEISAEAGDGGTTIRIVDHGAGIPAERRDEVFGMFGRPDGHPAGPGIGLASCRRIVERHGGRITIGATPGGGTTVTVQLGHGAGRTGQDGGGPADMT
ncbi:sensor histidine kinase [Actinoplanes utahensis]|uniref:sensor histidine kinase n=1 Tax=Actinoplanes utahensis TaxID=1869 RepID=UPI0007C7A73B|nr:ATP-binding protein [Actinoplanes utahensis]GIF29995.1 hypothetical protein Aut01nite_29810 [Actinoplanes utahensis]